MISTVIVKIQVSVYWANLFRNTMYKSKIEQNINCVHILSIPNVSSRTQLPHRGINTKPCNPLAVYSLRETHPGFKTHGDHHTKSKIGAIRGPKMDPWSNKTNLRIKKKRCHYDVNRFNSDTCLCARSCDAVKLYHNTYDSLLNSSVLSKAFSILTLLVSLDVDRQIDVPNKGALE